MAKIGGGSGTMPEYKIKKKSLKAEKEAILKASRKNPDVKLLLGKLKKLIPGLASQTVLLDLLASPGTAQAPSSASQDTVEQVAQFLFENGGRWPDKAFKEGYRGDPAASMAIYKSMVEENTLRRMADSSDMSTKGGDQQWYTPEQQETLKDRQDLFMRNLAQQTNSGQ